MDFAPIALPLSLVVVMVGIVIVAIKRNGRYGLLAGLVISLGVVLTSILAVVLLWYLSLFGEGDRDQTEFPPEILNSTSEDLYLLHQRVSSPTNLSTRGFSLLPARREFDPLWSVDRQGCIFDGISSISIVRSLTGRSLTGYDEDPRREENRAEDFEVLIRWEAGTCFGSDTAKVIWDGEEANIRTEFQETRDLVLLYLFALLSPPAVGEAFDRRRAKKLQQIPPPIGEPLS